MWHQTREVNIVLTSIHTCISAIAEPHPFLNATFVFVIRLVACFLFTSGPQ